MARGKKGGPSRMDLRRQAEAAEARERDEEPVEDEEVEDGDEAEGAEDEGGDDEEAAPKPKAKKAPAKKKTTTTKRTRTPKEVRMKAIWVVFDNGGKRVKEFPFPQKADAETLLAEKTEEKKGTFYLQLVKEPLEG
jgi:hypothetical protein